MNTVGASQESQLRSSHHFWTLLQNGMQRKPSEKLAARQKRVHRHIIPPKKATQNNMLSWYETCRTTIHDACGITGYPSTLSLRHTISWSISSTRLNMDTTSILTSHSPQQMSTNHVNQDADMADKEEDADNKDADSHGSGTRY